MGSQMSWSVVLFGDGRLVFFSVSSDLFFEFLNHLGAVRVQLWCGLVIIPLGSYGQKS